MTNTTIKYKHFYYFLFKIVKTVAQSKTRDFIFLMSFWPGHVLNKLCMFHSCWSSLIFIRNSVWSHCSQTVDILAALLITDSVDGSSVERETFTGRRQKTRLVFPPFQNMFDPFFFHPWSWMLICKWILDAPMYTYFSVWQVGGTWRSLRAGRSEVGVALSWYSPWLHPGTRVTCAWRSIIRWQAITWACCRCSYRRADSTVPQSGVEREETAGDPHRSPFGEMD